MTPETIITDQKIYDGILFDLHLRQAQLADGTPVKREIIEYFPHSVGHLF